MVLPRTPNSNRRGHYLRPHHLHRASDRPVGAGAVVLADRGYQTLYKDLDPDRVETPIYRTRYRPLTDDETQYNRDLSARRMPVEHAIGRMKWWHALSYWRRPTAAFDQTSKAIGILATLT